MSTMSTTTTFDLEAAIRAALPDWGTNEQAALAKAIRHDSAQYINETVTAARELPDNALDIVQRRMLQRIVESLNESTAADDADPNKDLDPDDPAEFDICEGTHVPVGIGTVDAEKCIMSKMNLSEEVGAVVPFLPKDAWGWLAGEVYQRLELKVGESLTEGMSDAMLDEFGYFVDQDQEGMNRWFEDYDPGFDKDKQFLELVEANPEATLAEVMSEYGAMKWLHMNRPDYPQVVARVTDGLLATLKARVAALGEAAFVTWARVHAGWVQIMGNATSPHDVLAGTTHLIESHGGAALETWSLVEKTLCSLNTRKNDGWGTDQDEDGE